MEALLFLDGDRNDVLPSPAEAKVLRRGAQVLVIEADPKRLSEMQRRGANILLATGGPEPRIAESLSMSDKMFVRGWLKRLANANSPSPTLGYAWDSAGFVPPGNPVR